MSKTIERLLKEAKVHISGVRDPETGEIQLYDIFVQGEWCGSRRTVEQCKCFLVEPKTEVPVDVPRIDYAKLARQRLWAKYPDLCAKWEVPRD